LGCCWLFMQTCCVFSGRAKTSFAGDSLNGAPLCFGDSVVDSWVLGVPEVGGGPSCFGGGAKLGAPPFRGAPG